jgi:hypothetical protein
VPAGQAPGRALADLAAFVRHLIADRGTNHSQLARRTGYPRQEISRVANGQRIPSEAVAEALDIALEAGGRINALRALAVREKQAHRLGLDLPAPDRREDPTNRRTFTLAALSLAAAEILQRTPDGSDALTIAEMESDIEDIAVRYDSTPHAELLPVVAAGWKQAEALLDRPQLGGIDARHLNLLAGQFAYFLGRISFADGRYRESRRFAEVSHRHASRADDPVLPGSLAALRSSIAFYPGRYVEAAEYAGRAQATAPPYLAARLAAYEARGWSAVQRRDLAADALTAMRAAAVDAFPLPGSSPFTAASADMFTAVCFVRLNDGRAAEPYARDAVERLSVGGSSYEERGHALLALADCHLRRERPDPAAAVAAGVAAVSVPAGHLTSTIVAAADRVWRRLATWHGDADVRRFGQLAASAQRALAAGGTA